MNRNDISGGNDGPKTNMAPPDLSALDELYKHSDSSLFIDLKGQ